MKAASQALLARPYVAVRHLLWGAEIVAGGEVVATAHEHDDADVQVFRRAGKGVVEFFQEHAALGVAVTGTVTG